MDDGLRPTARGSGPTVTILDVGHGNCAVLRDDAHVMVVDAPHDHALPGELARIGVSKIDHVVLSHADSDHIGGAVALLSRPSLRVGRLWFNPDAMKESDTWGDLRALAYQMHENGKLEVTTNLNSGAREIVISSRLRAEVLHPDIGMASTGPRPATSRESAMDANTFAAVLRVLLDDRPVVLLCADIDAAGLSRITERNVDLTADVLVFPHHGGSSHGSSDSEFARQLTQGVMPSSVIFSHGRLKWRNPLPEIVAGVREAAPNARIACTQLSVRCRVDDGPFPTTHLGEAVAAGRRHGISCAGSSVLQILTNGSLGVRPDSAAAHNTFVEQFATSPLCLAPTPAPTSPANDAPPTRSQN